MATRFLGGSYGDGEATRFGQRIKPKVPAKKVPQLVRNLVLFYQDQREEGETFNRFFDRLGPEPFVAIASEFKDAGPLNRENINTYLDWGKATLYKLERGEGECAI